MKPGWIGNGVILIGLGPSFVALGEESTAVFDACLASVTCSVDVAGLNVGDYLRLLRIGIALAVSGGTVLAVGFQPSSKYMDSRDRLTQPHGVR